MWNIAVSCVYDFGNVDLKLYDTYKGIIFGTVPKDEAIKRAANLTRKLFNAEVPQTFFAVPLPTCSY